MSDTLWCAADVAENFGNTSIRTAQDMLRRWEAAGLIHETARDTITAAPLYPVAEIRAARYRDLVELADRRHTYQPSTVVRSSTA